MGSGLKPFNTVPVDLDRLRALSDNIYAFSMTLLVTSLHLPNIPEAQITADMFSALQEDWRFLSVYAISFLIISSYWMLHHTLYTYIQQTSRVFIWLNILLLLSVTFTPFPTALMGKYGRNPETAFIYGLSMSASYLMLNLVTHYAIQHPTLLQSGLSKAELRILRLRFLIPLVFALLGTLFSLLYMKLTFLFFLLVALANATPWTQLLSRRNANR